MIGHGLPGAACFRQEDIDDGPLARFLRGEERLEEAALGGLVHAVPRVAHPKTNTGKIGVPRPTDLDETVAPVGHGIAGVGGQVHEYLFDLLGVSVHPQVAFLHRSIQRDPFAEDALQHARDIFDAFAGIERDVLDDLLAPEGEALLGQEGRALTGSNGVFEGFTIVTVGERLEREVQVAVDNGEQVAEIVRDTAGQTPE